MNKDYQLPSQKDAAKRSRNEVEIEYGLFSMNDQLEELGKFIKNTIFVHMAVRLTLEMAKVLRV